MCPLSSLLFSPTPTLNTETLEPGSQPRSGNQTLETITRARVKFNDNCSRTIRKRDFCGADDYLNELICVNVENVVQIKAPRYLIAGQSNFNGVNPLLPHLKCRSV